MSDELIDQLQVPPRFKNVFNQPWTSWESFEGAGIAFFAMIFPGAMLGYPLMAIAEVLFTSETFKEGSVAENYGWSPFVMWLICSLALAGRMALKPLRKRIADANADYKRETSMINLIKNEEDDVLRDLLARRHLLASNVLMKSEPDRRRQLLTELDVKIKRREEQLKQRHLELTRDTREREARERQEAADKAAEERERQLNELEELAAASHSTMVMDALDSDDEPSQLGELEVLLDSPTGPQDIVETPRTLEA